MAGAAAVLGGRGLAEGPGASHRIASLWGGGPNPGQGGRQRPVPAARAAGRAAPHKAGG